MNLTVNTVYFSALLNETLLYTGEELHYGIHGEGFNRFDGSTMFVHEKDVENLKLSPVPTWTAEEILRREG